MRIRLWQHPATRDSSAREHCGDPMTRNWAVLGGVALLATVALLLGRGLTEAPPVAQAEPTSEPVIALVNLGIAPVSSYPAGPSTAVPVAAAASTVPDVRGSEFGRKLLATTNVREFIADAMKHPEKGGALYTTLALKSCAGSSTAADTIKDVVERESTISADAIRRIEAAFDRCGNLSSDEIAELREQAYRLGADGKDALLAFRLELRRTQNEDPAKCNLMMLAAFKGNAAQASDLFVARRLLWSDPCGAADGVMKVVFAGQTYTDIRDLSALDIAINISTCIEGDYCQQDIDRELSCRNGGYCFDSREEYMKTDYDGDADFQRKVTAFTDVLRAAMARGDTSIFKR